MVRYAHGPAEHNIFGTPIQAADRVDFVARYAALSHDFVPRGLGESRLQFRPALAKTVKVRLVLDFCFDNALCDARQECEVAPDVRLDVQTGNKAAEQ